MERPSLKKSSKSQVGSVMEEAETLGLEIRDEINTKIWGGGLVLTSGLGRKDDPFLLVVARVMPLE